MKIEKSPSTTIRNPYWVYILTSFGFGLLTTVLALWSSSNGWQDFFNSKPIRGEMGFGRFIIRGSRYVDGKYTPFAYPWRSIEPSELGRLIAWLNYSIHQLGQWLILFKVQSSKQAGWSQDYRWWNWQMVYLNGFMLIFKVIHCLIFYDDLATDVPEGIAQGSVVLILIFAIVISIPNRGIIFGFGKKPSSDLVVQFIRKYHGYAMSFGTVLNFHYHPIEGTMGHTFGFAYQCLLIWQSTNFLHKSHRNKTWVLLLETWVFIHGTLTALIQPGIAWQIFSYGFLIMFLFNQIFDTRLSKKPILMGLLYTSFILYMYWGFRNDKAYYRATFIPVAEYACVYITLGIGKILQYSILPRLGNHVKLKKLAAIIAYLITTSILTIGLALILAGNLKVYNDY